MAAFTAIRSKTKNASALRGVIEYVDQKTRWGNAHLVTGHNYVPQSAQMTNNRFRKTGGTQFYHFVQSFSADDDTQINEQLWDGRHSPVWPDGSKHARNVYAHSEAECEKLLAAMISEMTAEIAAEKNRLKDAPKAG